MTHKLNKYNFYSVYGCLDVIRHPEMLSRAGEFLYETRNAWLAIGAMGEDQKTQLLKERITEYFQSLDLSSPSDRSHFAAVFDYFLRVPKEALWQSHILNELAGLYLTPLLKTLHGYRGPHQDEVPTNMPNEVVTWLEPLPSLLALHKYRRQYRSHLSYYAEADCITDFYRYHIEQDDVVIDPLAVANILCSQNTPELAIGLLDACLVRVEDPADRLKFVKGTFEKVVTIYLSDLPFETEQHDYGNDTQHAGAAIHNNIMEKIKAIVVRFEALSRGCVIEDRMTVTIPGYYQFLFDNEINIATHNPNLLAFMVNYWFHAKTGDSDLLNTIILLSTVHNVNLLDDILYLPAGKLPIEIFTQKLDESERGHLHDLMMKPKIAQLASDNSLNAGQTASDLDHFKI